MFPNKVKIRVLGKIPPGKSAPREITPRKSVPQEKYAPENCPNPPPPKKNNFVKLPHVMEYFKGENFVNFNFRQS